jgi:hypothetical protein
MMATIVNFLRRVIMLRRPFPFLRVNELASMLLKWYFVFLNLF